MVALLLCLAVRGAASARPVLPMAAGPTLAPWLARATPPRSVLVSDEFNKGDLLNIIMPLNARHFSDVKRLDLHTARVRCSNCTCGYSEMDGGFTLCNSAKELKRIQKDWVNGLATSFYFGLWYLLSIAHSVYNKRVTNVLPLPWTVATAQIVVGAIFVCTLWATKLRAPPASSATALRATARRMLPIGGFHAVGHISGVVGTAFGSVSFAPVVKSAGPVYACMLSTIVLKQAVSLRVWLSLLPILGGVALATTNELTFAWAALIGAVVSDLALALRNVYSKISMSGSDDSESMSAANTFGLTTCLAAVISVPFALAAEGRIAGAAWRAAAPTAIASRRLFSQVVLTGLYFYGYSEVAMKALNNVHPVTHAIGNTMRRVVISLICIVVFATPISLAGAVGSAVAISGSYFYAMVKQGEKAAAEKAAAEAEAEAEATGLPHASSA